MPQIKKEVKKELEEAKNTIEAMANKDIKKTISPHQEYEEWRERNFNFLHAMNTEAKET